jgi:hypothetical protein
MVEARIVFYLAAAYVFSLAKDAHHKITEQLIESGHRVSHAGQNKFLTVIGMKINFYYMLTSIVVVLITRKYSTTRKFMSWFWASIVFPVACVVCGMYWALVMINPDLVGPASVRHLFKGLPDHLLHTFPVFIQMVEAMFVKHERVSKAKIVLGNLVFLGAYLSYSVHIKQTEGKFAYPILEELWAAGPPMFVAFVAACAILFFGFSRLAVKLNAN